MRLTLRTLLAYLDDTLEPAEAREIGQKIAESEQARELIERIDQVTHRRRITTPPPEGPGAMLDANTLGEYLDNDITPEQAGEIEEIFLTSDNHLAEIAACHQVLSLILSEPALVPPSAKQRMYAVVRGPEAIPFRKPPPSHFSQTPVSHDGRDEDETLRLGVPPVGGGRHPTNPLWMIAAGIAVVCLVLVAAWQVLKNRDDGAAVNQGGPQVTQVNPNDDKSPFPENKEPDKDQKPPMDDKKPIPVETKPPEEVKMPMVGDVPWTLPSVEMKPIGKLRLDPKEPAILLAFVADMMEWRRILPKSPEVLTGQPLVSLPASKSVIDLEKGLTLTLLGNVPELYLTKPSAANVPVPRFYEGALELHTTTSFDLDVTLRRGRIRIATADRPARVRVRFDNPTRPQQHEFFDLALEQPGTEVLIERWFTWVDNEKFYRDPKAVDRIGPLANMSCFVLTGTVGFRHQEITRKLTAAPGFCLAYWLSVSGLDQPHSFDNLPDGLISPQQPAGTNGIEAMRARNDLSQKLSTKSMDVALVEALKGPDSALRKLACRCLGAIDDISTLLEQLEQEPDFELRFTADETLRNWTGIARDHDYKLHDALKIKYRPNDADAIMTLLHGFNEKTAKTPETLDLLVSQLTSPQLAIRELAALRLDAIIPGRQRSRYNAADPPAARQQAQMAWRALLPPNPMPMGK